MRYAVFSDIHANRQAWEAVLADIREQEADTIDLASSESERTARRKFS